MTTVATATNISPITAWRHARGLSVDDLAEIASGLPLPGRIAMLRAEILAAEAGLDRPLSDRLEAVLCEAGVREAHDAWLRSNR